MRTVGTVVVDGPHYLIREEHETVTIQLRRGALWAIGRRLSLWEWPFYLGLLPYFLPTDI
jgi:hypothetical protein